MIFEQLFKSTGLHVLAHAGYSSGLALAVPVISAAWNGHLAPWLAAPLKFWSSSALILVGLAVLFMAVGSISSLFKSAGWMMILPGVITIAFTAMGSDFFFNLAGTHIQGFAVVEPTVRWAVNHVVPQAAYVGAIYILVGVLLVWCGRRVQGFKNKL